MTVRRWTFLSRSFSNRPNSNRGRALLKGLTAGLLALAAAACGSTGPVYDSQATLPQTLPIEPSQPQPPAPRGENWTDQPEFMLPQHMADSGISPVRVALLLPLGAEDAGVRQIAKGMRDAAELALFQINRPDLLIMHKDTKGTPEGAQRAARRALDQGAEIILGPLFADSVTAIKPMTLDRGVPVVAFSSDRQVAGDNVLLLSFQVEEEIRHVVRFALRQQLTDFAALVPENAYGNRVHAALQEQVQMHGGILRHLQSYNPYTDDFRQPVKAIAEYGRRQRALASQRADLTRMVETVEDEAATRALARLSESDTWGPVSYQAVLLPEGGTKLRSLAPMLPYYDIDNRTVRFIGTGLWDDPSLWNEAALQGGWFAAPSPANRDVFSKLFTRNFDYEPPRLASLAYDAVTLSAALSQDAPMGNRFTFERLTVESGFAGIDGLFRFRRDGATERGLAILQIEKGEAFVVKRAPASFAEEGFDDFGTENDFWGQAAGF